MKHYSRIIPIVLTTAALLCGGNAFAQDEAGGGTGTDEDLLRNLFQRLEVYLGIMQANEREHQNLLRSVPPPNEDQSAQAGEEIQRLAELAAVNETALAEFSIGRNMLQPTNSVSNSSIVTAHISGFCSAEEAELNICQKGLSVDEGGAADLLADTLLANPTVGQINSAIAFIYMLTNPNPIPLPDNTFQSEDLGSDITVAENTPMEAKYGESAVIKTRPLTSEGVRTLAARYKQMALLSTAQFALNNIAAERSRPQGQSVSAFEALKQEAERRFNSATWHEQVNTLPDTALLREMVTMQAMQLALDFKRYEQEQTIITLLAAQVATTAQTLATSETAFQMQ
jgi:hypothetical protein